MDKAAVFIDGGYFAKVLKLVFPTAHICFEKFSDELCKEAGYERLRSYFYSCMPYQDSPPTSEQSKRYAQMDSFVYNLQKLRRFEVRLGKLIYIPKMNDYIQKRVDVLLAVDLVRMSWDHQINAAILITGDSDFVPAISAAKDAGVSTILYYSRGHAQVGALDELLYTCDDRHEISKKHIDASKRT
jgi:uncharacterized LabA/DUF88 family protein